MSGGPQTPPLFDLPKVTAIGIASPTAGFLTSGFGVAGTLVGMALTAVIVTAVADVLKVYLARAPSAVTKIPKGLRKSRWRTAPLGRVWLAFKALGRIRLAFSSFRSLPAARRRSILISSIVASVVSFLIGISIVTSVELSVGQRLSCWAWNECPAGEASTASSSASSTATTLSAFLGGQSQAAPPAQQPPPSDAKQGLPPSQQGAFPDSEQPGVLQPSHEEPSQEGRQDAVTEDRRDTQAPVPERQPGEEDGLGRDEQNEQEGGKQNPDPR